MQFIKAFLGIVLILILVYPFFLQGSAIIPVSKTDPLFQEVTQSDNGPIAWHLNRHVKLSWIDLLYIRWAIAKFPDLATCKASQTDIDISWSRIKTKEQLLLCIYHVVSVYKSRSEYMDWLVETGTSFGEYDSSEFKIGNNNNTQIETDILFGLTSQTNEDITKIHGPFVFILKTIGGSYGPSVRFSEDGNVIQVRYFWQSPIN